MVDKKKIVIKIVKRNQPAKSREKLVWCVFQQFDRQVEIRKNGWALQLLVAKVFAYTKKFAIKVFRERYGKADVSRIKLIPTALLPTEEWRQGQLVEVNPPYAGRPTSNPAPDNGAKRTKNRL